MRMAAVGPHPLPGPRGLPAPPVCAAPASPRAARWRPAPRGAQSLGGAGPSGVRQGGVESGGRGERRWRASALASPRRSRQARPRLGRGRRLPSRAAPR